MHHIYIYIYFFIKYFLELINSYEKYVLKELDIVPERLNLTSKLRIANCKKYLLTVPPSYFFPKVEKIKGILEYESGGGKKTLWPASN